MNVTQALEQYLQYVKITLSEATYKFDLGKSNKILIYFKDTECAHVDRGKILGFIEYLKKSNPKIENSTINKYVQLLLRAIESECAIKINFKKLREKTKMIKIISPEIIQKVFYYYDKEIVPEHLRNNLMFRLMLDTGLRISELLSLKYNDINIQDSSILVKKTKNSRERRVYFTHTTSVIMTKYLVSQKIKDYIFIDLITREQLKSDRVQKICQNLQKKLKINSSITPHKWRHTFATNFINVNGNLEILRSLMGHRSITTTQLYLHMNTQTIKNEYFRVMGD